MSKKLEKLFGDTYLARNVPESVHIPPLGDKPHGYRQAHRTSDAG
jgi:hypothetical protein